MIEAIKSKGGFDWLATVFYPLAVMLMEVFWVYPWLFWLGSLPAFGESRPVLSLASVVITLAASLLLTRIALRREWSLWRMRSVIIGAGLVVILIVLGVEYREGYSFLSGEWFGHVGRALANTFDSPGAIVLAVPALLYLWWRGITLGQATAYFKDIYRTFILGMAALIVLIIFWQISTVSERFTGPGVDIGWYIMAFFFCGLTAIALCHIYLMRSSMPREEAARTSVWRWLPITLGVIGGMVLVGFGIASIFSPELYEGIGRGLGAIGDFLGKILGYILVPVIYVFEWLVRLVKYILSLLRGEQVEQPFTDNGTLPDWGEVTPGDMPVWLTEAIKWFVVALIIGLVLFILAKAVSRIRSRRNREEIEEIHESLFSWKGLRDDLKELLKSLFKRKEELRQEYHFDENIKGEMDIREIYRHLQWEGKNSGIARRRYETADEYANHLKREVPDSSVPLDEITRRYDQVRYGDNIMADDEIHEANGLWEKLRAMIRKIREVS